MDLPNDATLGVAAGGLVTPSVYVQAGFSDANADPTSPFEGFENVFDEGDFFKWVEIHFCQDALIPQPSGVPLARSSMCQKVTCRLSK